ncbi:N,N-dimethylformamidase beta subunit family domain-containing protein [Kitasatospora sp. NPDC015120]|uniref:N,N-dimethylformamidase beta subunit family domain-containing protein n=1 Tax=Kitasatospora sp. NPDC015120 TaxID=3364023 RepID=UPI0036F4524E
MDGQRGMAGRRRFLGLTLAAAAAGACSRSPTPAPPGTRSSATPPAATAAPAEAAPTPTEAENALPGDAGWRITAAGPPEAVEGYAAQVSALPGERVRLHVSTTAPAFRVSAYRMGWYGGARARLLWRSPPLPGGRRPPAVVDPRTRTVTTAWEPSAELDTTGWPPGSYLLRLDAVDGEGQRYVPLTIRSAATAGTLVVVNAVGTWQAYNQWGGHDLYDGPSGGLATRSLEVSFDRPYLYDDGAGLFLVYEAPLIALAERLGLPLSYVTGVDVHRRPGILDGAHAVLSPGHDEYWSPEQRAAVSAARDAGTNLAVLGANCCFRRVRYQPSPLGEDRIMACWKGDWARDPGYLDGGPATTDFRLGPGADPESSLLGVLYDGYPVDAPYVVTAPGHWIFDGTGVAAGDSFEHLVGVEYDTVDAARSFPRPLEIVSHSPVVCDGRRARADTAYYTHPSGAAVFACGTMRWVESLDAEGPAAPGVNHGLDGRTGALTRRVTENVLRAFAAGPAAAARPAQDNVRGVYPA